MANGKKHWSEANARRGLSHADIAMDFVETFPVGTTLTITQSDEWAAKNGLLPAPSPEARTDKQSNEWKAHLMRRHEQKTLLNKAGAHPRMHENGSMPFFIAKAASNTPGKYVVQSPEDEAFRGKLARKIQSITVHYRRWLAYQLQAPNYISLPPEVKSMAEQCHLNVEDFGQRTNLDAGLLIKRLEGLKSRLGQIGYNVPVPQIEDLTLDDLMDFEENDLQASVPEQPLP